MPTETELNTLYHEMESDRGNFEKKANFYEALAEARAEALQEKCPENEINLQTISDMSNAMGAAIKEFGLTQPYGKPMWDVVIEALRESSNNSLKTAFEFMPAWWVIGRSQNGWCIDAGENLRYVETIEEIPAAIQDLLKVE